MSRLWPVIRREYVERVRSKAFLFSTIGGPILMMGVMSLPTLLESRQTSRSLRIVVDDETGDMGREVAEGLLAEKANGVQRFEIAPSSSADTSASLQKRVLAGDLDGYLRIPANALSSSEAEYHGKNVSHFLDLGLMEKVVRRVVLTKRLEQEGIAGSRVAALTRPLELKTLRVSEGGEREDRGGAFFLAFFMALMLYVTVLVWGQALMNGVIEEKSNRAVEVLVSSLPTTILFAGKLLGVGAVGLTQFLVWTVTLLGAGLVGGPALAAMGFLPEVPVGHVVALVIFFVLGYFLYAALYAAIGASVNTQQEAQSLAFPVAMPLILAFVLTTSIVSHPDSPLTTILSFVPPLTPILMFARVVAQAPPTWQVVVSIGLLLVTIAFVNWAAARIYRVGILMYGKRPTLPEILKWVRAA